MTKALGSKLNVTAKYTLPSEFYINANKIGLVSITDQKWDKIELLNCQLLQLFTGKPK